MKKMIIIDNYDSFTYNLKQLIGSVFMGEIDVRRNDVLLNNNTILDEYDYIVISPGPGKPEDIPYVKDAILKYYQKKPILGICLGMQCINEIFGGKTIKAEYPIHGKTSQVKHHKTSLFIGIPQDIDVARYHSLVVSVSHPDLIITAELENGVIMGIQHKCFPLFGLQFHPESFLTEYGDIMIKNFLRYSNEF